MSAALALADYGTMQSRGTSSFAAFVAEQYTQSRRRLQESYALLGLTAKGVFDELAVVAQECCEPDWDGYGAEAVSGASYVIAKEFLEALPVGTRPPSVGAEPDGQFTLEWYHSPYRVLSVSIDPNGVLHYASLLGSAKRYGTEPFYGAAPKVILDLIGQVMA